MAHELGSVWRKWDLHVHSPASHGYVGSWAQFEEQLKSSEAEVIGINDYFSVAGYARTKKRIEDGDLDLGDKVILPVVEFRMRDVLANRHTGASGTNINFHVIFDPIVEVEAIETFIKGLKVGSSQIGSRYENDSEFLKETARVYLERDVLQPLQENEDFKDRFLLWLPYDEYGGIGDINPDSDDWIKRGFVNMAHLLGSSNKNQIDFFLWKSPLNSRGKPKFSRDDFKKWFDHPKGSIKGSDSHQHTYPIGKLRDKHSNPIEKFCWIKGEPIFETVKQIVYEPEGRVFIGRDKPLEPTNTIERFTLNIPNDAEIELAKKDGSRSSESFCFAGHTETYSLSPYFNTFIGGRGTGKSTILNFFGIRSREADSSKDFWATLKPSFSPHDESVFSHEGVKNFEFIGQSKVEQFATDRDAFTAAIYKRADALSGGELSTLEGALGDAIDELAVITTAQKELTGYADEKDELNEERKTLKKSLKIVESEAYKETSEEITEKSNQLSDLMEWRESVEAMRETIESTLDEEEDKDTDYGPEEDDDDTPPFTPLSSAYQTAVESATKHIESAIKVLDASNFKAEAKSEVKLEEDIEKLEQKLTKLLEKSGLSEENILQVKSAPQRIVQIDTRLEKLTGLIKAEEQKIGNYEQKLTAVKTAKTSLEESIGDSLNPLTASLKEQAEHNNKEDIKEIGLQYYFDEKKAWEDLVLAVIDVFEDEIVFDGRADSLSEFIYKNKDVFSKDRKNIQTLLNGEKNGANYMSFLNELFAHDDSFVRFRSIRDSHLNNANEYKKVQVLYDGRDVEHASFGQKCTTVIVILMLFGNHPLIIDEPEAHLDSSLIANYLVPLIKKNKVNRQIIFATHNANFVVNGDSEKIFILSSDDGDFICTETVIEDLENRNSLLKLEGGQDAFKMRSDKLNILSSHT